MTPDRLWTLCVVVFWAVSIGVCVFTLITSWGGMWSR